MSLVLIAVTYITCWWLVLFMVLPHQADAPKTPGLGHAPSAPANPQIGKKLRWTTLLAILPTALVYFAIGSAQAAEDEIYHASSGGCESRATTYRAPADLSAKDGQGASGKAVKPATLGGASKLVDTENLEIPIQIPSEKYLEKSNYNADMSHSFIEAGKLKVKADGTTTLNEKPIAPEPEECQ